MVISFISTTSTFLLTTFFYSIDAASLQQQGCATCMVTPTPCVTCVPQQSDQWGTWGAWSECTLQYGTYSQTRHRVCLSGANKCTGGNGGAEEAIRCTPTTTTTTTTAAPPPQWSEWGPWNKCSVSCGGGVESRTRTCLTTQSQCGSAIAIAIATCRCQGAAVEQRSCNTQACCAWNSWGEWSECSVTCGSGLQLRTRGCSSSSCIQCGANGGEALQQRACQMPKCPSTCITCVLVTTTPSPPPCITCEPPSPSPSTIPCITCTQQQQQRPSGGIPTIIGSKPAPSIIKVLTNNNSIPTIPSIGSNQAISSSSGNNNAAAAVPVINSNN